ncbi:MAG: glycerophosphodiester phosphodiesterase [Candidatus Sigynarchaeota archaeon]
MILFGHRGAMAYEPENTLASFTTAVGMGVDGIELDVYTSEDGHVVVSHVDSLDIDGHLYRITKLPLAEIKKIELPKQQRVPTLDEVFSTMEKLRDGKLFYSIDLKDVRDAEAYHAVLVKHGVHARVFTCMESRLFIKKVQRQFPDLTYVLSTHATSAGVIEDLDKVDPAIIKVVNVPVGEASKAIVDAIHAKGLKSFIWDVNDEKAMREAASWGPDALYSNYPDVLVQVAGKK